MKKKKVIFGLILFITGIILTLVWYDWKLLLIWFILTWSNNIEIDANINK